jgi:hypothetical protein
MIWLGNCFVVIFTTFVSFMASKCEAGADHAGPSFTRRINQGRRNEAPDACHSRF